MRKTTCAVDHFSNIQQRPPPSVIKCEVYHFGAFTMIPIVQPARVPTTGTVTTHEKMIQAKARQLTFPNPPEMIPTPVVAPTMHMVVDTGIPSVHQPILRGTEPYRVAVRESKGKAVTLTYTATPAES